MLRNELHEDFPTVFISLENRNAISFEEHAVVNNRIHTRARNPASNQGG